MKKWVVLLFICCLANNFSQTNISPQFSELKGMEDQLGNTHLFYRIQTAFSNPPVYDWSNHIFHLDLHTGIDTVYISSSGHEDPAYNFNKWVGDVDYWNNNPDEFIYCGGATTGQFFEGSAYITRFDGYINYFGWFWGTADYIDMSQSDDSLLYSGIITDGGPGILKSTNGGRSWDTVSVLYQFLSLNPYNENIYFVENEDRELFRTTDSGNTFSLVDPEFLVDTRFYYDPDGQHMYRKANNKLIVSDNLGEQFSWETVYTKPTTDPFYFTNDISLTGSIFISEGKNIFVSTDYGDNFSLYKTLDRKIVGIYKKPNSNKLYVATKYKIYEIIADTIQIVKSLPAIDDLQWYPISIGNKWVFENYREDINFPGIKDFLGISVMEVIGDSTLSNQNNYYLLNYEPIYWDIDTALIRTDSLNSKLYLYDPDDSSEILYEDFIVEVGDTIWIDTVEYKTVISDGDFSVWGLSTKKRVIDYSYRFQGYELVKEIGLFKWGFSDFFAIYTKELKGCVINGVVYGDTTVVSVENEETPIANEFKLEQNYPNPFNPNTVISYRLPVTSNVTLKVYDVLGNEVATLVNEELPAGEYEVEFQTAVRSRQLTSGIYFYQLKADSFIETKKMILIK